MALCGIRCSAQFVGANIAAEAEAKAFTFDDAEVLLAGAAEAEAIAFVTRNGTSLSDISVSAAASSRDSAAAGLEEELADSP